MDNMYSLTMDDEDIDILRTAIKKQIDQLFDPEILLAMLLLTTMDVTDIKKYAALFNKKGGQNA